MMPMKDDSLTGTVLPRPASDQTCQALTLSSDGLLSKWGFNDGDLPDWIWDVCDEQSIDVDSFGWHDVLWNLINNHLLPALDQRIELARIETNHNPVRASTVDGVDVEDQWPQESTVRLTPASVSVPVSDVLDAIRRVAAS